MLSYEIPEIFENTYFEEHLRTTPFSSSIKLDSVDLTIFSDLNLRLAKINKSLTTGCVSKFSRFCSHASSFLRYQAKKLQNFVLFIHFQWIDVKSNRCFSGLTLISIILREYWENNKTFWYYSYENKRIISWKIVRLFFFEIIQSVPTSKIIVILIRIYVRIS